MSNNLSFVPALDSINIACQLLLQLKPSKINVLHSLDLPTALYICAYIQYPLTHLFRVSYYLGRFYALISVVCLERRVEFHNICNYS